MPAQAAVKAEQKQATQQQTNAIKDRHDAQINSKTADKADKHEQQDSSNIKSGQVTAVQQQQRRIFNDEGIQTIAAIFDGLHPMFLHTQYVTSTYGSVNQNKTKDIGSVGSWEL